MTRRPRNIHRSARRFVASGAASLAAAAMCGLAVAGTEHEVLVQSPYAAKGECFGTTVAVSHKRDRLFAGVPYSRIPMLHSGRVDVFGVEGWGPQVTFIGSIFPEVMQRGAQFGASMSLDPGVGAGVGANGALVIGAPGEDLGTTRDVGAVEVYSLSVAGLMPTRVMRVLSPVASELARFGASVSVDLGESQSHVVIGEPGGGGPDRPGIAHVYRSTAGVAGPWEPLVQLQSVYAAAGQNRFGSEVLVAGSSLFVVSQYSGGVVECFELGDAGVTANSILWNEGSAWVDGSRFGASIATDGTRLAAGSPGVDGMPGSVFIYERTGVEPDITWALSQVLSPPNGVDCSGFGTAVALQAVWPQLRVGIVSSDPSEPWGGGFADYQFVDGSFQVVHVSTGAGDDALGASIAVAADASADLSGFWGAIAAPGTPSGSGEPLAGGVVAIVNDPGSNGDLNHDGGVDGQDLARVLGAILNGDCPLCAEDLNHDGVVNGNDIAILLSNWGVVP